MLRRPLFALSAALAAGMLFSAPVFPHSGDMTFDWDQFTTPATKRALARNAAALDMASIAREVAEFLPVVRNPEGRTLLPAGTVVDSVEFKEGVLTVTFHIQDADAILDMTSVETASSVIIYNTISNESLREVQLLGRRGNDSLVVPLIYLTDMAMIDKGWEEIDAPLGDNEPSGCPPPDYGTLYDPSRWGLDKNITAQGPLGYSGMPMGGLAGRTVFISGGHGWNYLNDAWRLERPRLLSMNEDYGNADMLIFTTPYLFNAGATIVPARPIGYQPAEVIVDNANGSPAYTESGIWSTSTNSVFFGATGSFSRFANANTTEDATATFAPLIPTSGFYPVYTWVVPGTNRIPGQLYRIRHTGGESMVRINHRRVGFGWVYLGTYHFEAGRNPAIGSVVVSNLRPPNNSTGSVVIADAIRFGNGIGDIPQGGGVSGFTRQEEINHYWITRGLGQGITEGSFWGTTSTQTRGIIGPARLARRMRQNDGQGYYGDVYIGFHSNAANGDARGAVSLFHSTAENRPLNQAALADIITNQINIDSQIEQVNWERNWVTRASTTLGGLYGEINANNLGVGSLNGTIIEVAFHDNPSDALLLRDPKFRAVVGRATYRGLVRYFRQFDTVTSTPATFLPEPPRRIRAVTNGPDSATISWVAPPTGGANGGAATSYLVYRSTNGLGFGNAVSVNGTSVTISGLQPGSTHFFRVSAVNAGGESMPTEVVSVKTPTIGAQTRTLIVNGYDRLDRFNNIPRFPTLPAGQETEQLILRRNNSYDYVRQHGFALAANGVPFDSTSNEAVIANEILLTNYDKVVWILGEEGAADRTFDAAERARVETFLNGGGRLFLSGANVGRELAASANGGLNVAPTFFSNVLRAGYLGNNANTFAVTGVAGDILAGVSINFSPGTTMYNVDEADRLAATNGSRVVANYSGGNGGGAILVYEGSSGEKIFFMGFPFETINSETVRNTVMQRALNFFGPATQVNDWSVF